MSIKFIFLFLCILMFNTKAYAYLDPGSAGIIQMLLAAIAGAFASLLIYWNKFKNFLAKIFKKKKADEEQDSQ